MGEDLPTCEDLPTGVASWLPGDCPGGPETRNELAIPLHTRSDSATVGTNTNIFLPALSERSIMASTLSGRRSPLPAILPVSPSPRQVLMRPSEAPLAEVLLSKIS